MPNNNIKNGLREKFLKAYSNLPLNTRKEIILVLEERGPITWEVAYLEIKNSTERGNYMSYSGLNER